VYTELADQDYGDLESAIEGRAGQMTALGPRD
jgi:hypothetical protein